MPYWRSFLWHSLCESWVIALQKRFIISYENHSSKQFFEILCYDKYPSWFIWHIPCESRVHSTSENVCHTNVRKVCLNYMFCTMWWLIRFQHYFQISCLHFVNNEVWFEPHQFWYLSYQTQKRRKIVYVSIHFKCVYDISNNIPYKINDNNCIKILIG